MATIIEAAGDTISFERAFVSGNDLVTINGEPAFDGVLGGSEPQVVEGYGRTYSFQKQKLHAFTSAASFQVKITEGGKEIHSGIYDRFGQRLDGEGRPAARAAKVCATVCAVAAALLMVVFNPFAPYIPSRLISSVLAVAVGAGVGGGFGHLIGGFIFRKR